ncbi:MAG: aminotransferase class III-fold pyridoxal phosphate-dependent enzyme [Microbacterium sp.]|uniref:aminotransferase family protein n=1 Tax=Microbacterium sp. TaxID=51671 RepID=UPI0039E48398
MSSDSALMPSSTRSLPLATRGRGVWIWDENGKDYLDGSSGPVAVNLGECHPDVVAAIARQAETLSFAHRIQFRNEPVERLASEVVELLGPDFDRAMFVNSGSEANELALKLAFLHWDVKGMPEKTKFVTTTNSYHGSTLANIQISGQPRYSAAFRPLVTANERVRAPYLHRIRVDECIADPEPVVLERLRDDFAALDHEHTAAILIETVGGASAAALVPPPGYFELLRELCDTYRMLWIADEVMAGFARTGRWFGFQHWRATPDLVVFAKGVSGGYAPLGGVGISRRVSGPLLHARGAVTAGHTYSNNPIGAAAGVASIEVMRRDRLVEAAAEHGATLGEGLRRIQRDSASIVDVRGIGLMWGVEFGDPATGKPFPTDEGFTPCFVDACAAEGLLVYPSRGGVDGVSGDAVLVSPPVVISSDEIAELLARFERGLRRLEAAG